MNDYEYLPDGLTDEEIEEILDAHAKESIEWAEENLVRNEQNYNFYTHSWRLPL
jgi:hypothetical protein